MVLPQVRSIDPVFNPATTSFAIFTSCEGIVTFFLHNLLIVVHPTGNNLTDMLGADIVF